MPTSSQALIILATEGRLPKNVPRRTFPVSSVPYPVRNLDISQQCMECIDGEEDSPTNVYEIMRKGRVRLSSLTDSLPDILKISRLRGTLTYDIESKMLKWQVNTEYSPRPEEENFVTHNTWYPGMSNQNNVRFPNIYQNQHNGQFDFPYTDRGTKYYQNYIPDTQMFKNPKEAQPISQEDQDYYLGNNKKVTFEDQAQVRPSRAPSLPVLFKARIDDETYRRLCGLSFRQRKSEESAETKGTLPSYQKHRHSFGGWTNKEKVIDDMGIENPETQVSYDKIKDKDFRIEDLGLNPNNAASKFRMTHAFENHGQTGTLHQYLQERNAFFAKYGNYGSEEIPVGIPSGTRHLEQKLRERKSLQAQLVLPEIGSVSYTPQ